MSKKVKQVVKVVEDILKERQSTHGDYGTQAEVAEKIKDILLAAGYKSLPWYIRYALDLIIAKVSRMVCGDYTHLDHFDDIKGYAELAKREVIKNKK